MQVVGAACWIARLRPRALALLPEILSSSISSVCFPAVSLADAIANDDTPSSDYTHCTTRRNFAVSLTDQDDLYRLATQQIWDQTRQQKRFASKIEYALNTELLKRNTLREFFVGECGFQIVDVRLSRDNMKAFILWSAFPAHMETAQIGLTRHLKQLRAAVAQRIQTRAVPRLEFRQNRVTAEQAKLENLLDSLKMEREQEAEENEISDDRSNSDSEADESEAITQQRPING